LTKAEIEVLSAAADNTRLAMGMFLCSTNPDSSTSSS
jgi:hypothetical protein